MFVYEWITIQNIVVEKDYNKMMVEELGDDVCTYLSLEKCVDMKDVCKVKDNDCISVSRYKKMQSSPGRAAGLVHSEKTRITSRVSGESFQVIQSKHIDNVGLANIQMYYVVVRSIRTNHIYVLFSSGMVLDADDFIYNEKVNRDLMELIMSIKRVLIDEPNTRFVFGGHSMGSTLALYTGYLFWKHDPEKFNTNIFVVGTGIAKSVSNDMLDGLRGSPNILQFISGEARHSKTKHKILYDCLRDKGNMNMWTPIQYIYTDADDDVISYHMSQNPEYDLEIGNDGQCKKIHMWIYYFQILEKIYKSGKTFRRKFRKMKHDIHFSASSKNRPSMRSNRQSRTVRIHHK